jgi:hypothetical protein
MTFAANSRRGEPLMVRGACEFLLAGWTITVGEKMLPKFGGVEAQRVQLEAAGWGSE